jgi:hypothetical protein
MFLFYARLLDKPIIARFSDLDSNSTQFVRYLEKKAPKGREDLPVAW